MKTQEQDFYEKFWKKQNTGDAIFESHPDWSGYIDQRAEFFRPAIKGKVLDAGCGFGDFAFYIADNPGVTHVSGMDISQTAVNKCKLLSRKKNLSKKTDFKTSSVTSIPYSKNSFDSVFSFETVEHIVDCEQMFKEFNRVLKKGGLLSITTVDFNLLKMIIIAALYFETYFDPRTPHIRFFTKKTLEASLKRAGFKVIKYAWDGSYFGLMPKGQKLIARKVKDLS